MKLLELAELAYDLVNKNPDLQNKEVLFLDVDNNTYHAIEGIEAENKKNNYNVMF